MKLSLIINLARFRKLKEWILSVMPWSSIVIVLSMILSATSILHYFLNDQIVAYGDAESHLNIAKRVIHSITPGFAQLGGIWLPLPHLMMLPFIWNDYLWRTGLAGALVSAFSYVVSSYVLFLTIRLITKNNVSAFVGSLVFMLNLNVLYLQSTPMTELTLIMFFILSSYYFIRFLLDETKVLSLIIAGFFGFCATLSRYDGWFLVIIEAGIIVLLHAYNKEQWHTLAHSHKKKIVIVKAYAQKVWHMMIGKFIAFGTPAFFGIIVWMAWDKLILGDPLYFTNSQFSAKSQQQNWLLRGELPTYRNLAVSIEYYLVTAMVNIGIVLSFIAIVGVLRFMRDKSINRRYVITLLQSVPFIFYIVTLFMGQSVVFIPHITPRSFTWTLFNVRYGVMAVPAAAFFIGYLFSKCKTQGKLIILGIFVLQLALFGIGFTKIITLEDGTVGLSHAKRPDAEFWIKKNYTKGYVLIDDYARTLSIVRSGIPMQNVIYLGNKPYYDNALREPEKYADWIIMQKDDAIWTALYKNVAMQGRIFKYYQKAYTSPDILIFRRTALK